MTIKRFLFNDDGLLLRFLPPGICSADDGAGGYGGGSGGDGKGGDKNDGGDNDQDISGGLMGNADADDANEDGDDKGGDDKGGVIEVDGQKIEVPKQFWDAEKKTINATAALKSAIDSRAAVTKLQNELKEAKAGAGGKAPEKATDYLSPDILEKGVIAKPEGVVKLSDIKTDDPALVKWMEVAHKHGLTQAQFAGIIADTMLIADGFAPEPFDPEAEAKKFGPNAKAVAGANRAWADNLLKAGSLSKAEWSHLVKMGGTAVGLSVVNKLRMASGGKAIPANLTGVEGELPSKDEWYAKKPDARTEPDAYARWQEQGKELFGTDPAGSSESGLGVPPSRGGQMGGNVQNRKK